MKINVINKIIFHKNIFKNKSKRKRKFIIYHFLVESKPHERIDLLITARKKKEENIPKKKERKYSSNNENMVFCRKTHETIGNPPPF